MDFEMKRYCACKRSSSTFNCRSRPSNAVAFWLADAGLFMTKRITRPKPSWFFSKLPSPLAIMPETISARSESKAASLASATCFLRNATVIA